MLIAPPSGWQGELGCRPRPQTEDGTQASSEASPRHDNLIVELYPARTAQKTMSLAAIMIEQLAVARRIVEDGHEVVPAWRIATPEAAFLILTRFDPDKPEQRDRALFLISRFMTWKMATSFVVAAETWPGAEITRSGEEAVLCVGVSRLERLCVIQRIHRGDSVHFGPHEWLDEEQIDDVYFQLLPTGMSEISAEEAAELAAIFGEDGELAAERLS